MYVTIYIYIYIHISLSLYIYIYTHTYIHTFAIFTYRRLSAEADYPRFCPNP